MSDQLHPGMAAAMERFHQPKAPGDIDLVAEVRNILNLNGLMQEAAAHFDNHKLIIDAQGKTSDVQRHLMNRYWNLQLSMVPNSTDLRYMLIPNGTVEKWLELFKSTIVPVLVEQRMPKAITVTF